MLIKPHKLSLYRKAATCVQVIQAAIAMSICPAAGIQPSGPTWILVELYKRSSNVRTAGHACRMQNKASRHRMSCPQLSCSLVAETLVHVLCRGHVQLNFEDQLQVVAGLHCFAFMLAQVQAALGQLTSMPAEAASESAKTVSTCHMHLLFYPNAYSAPDMQWHACHQILLRSLNTRAARPLSDITLLQQLLACLGLISQAQAWPLQRTTEVWDQGSTRGHCNAWRRPCSQFCRALHAHCHPAKACMHAR